MKRAIIAVLLLLTACRDDAMPLAAYQKPADAIADVMLLEVFGIVPCGSVENINGARIYSIKPVEHCYKMEAPRRFKGVWLDEFEGSQFYENASSVRAVKVRIALQMRDQAVPTEWLSWSDHAKPSAPSRVQTRRMYLIEFIGRRTLKPGRYGHAGMANSQVVVDRLIAAQMVHASSEGYVKDEMVAQGQLPAV